MQKLRYFLRPVGSGPQLPPLPRRRILLTWLSDNFRFNGLVLPVLKEIGPDRCVVLGAKPGVLSRVPEGTPAILWDRALQFDRTAWRTDYRKCRRPWQAAIAALCRKYGLPRGACDLLGLHMLFGSQHVAGCLAFLRDGAALGNRYGIRSERPLVVPGVVGPSAEHPDVHAGPRRAR